MAINFDTKKGAEKLSGFLQKTTEAGKSAAESMQKGAAAFSEKASEAGKRAVDSVQTGAAALSEKVKQDSYARKVKKYNPFFPEEYLSVTFCVPNMIVIVDEADRRNVDVCEGAMGWRSNQNGVEVMHLYDECVKLSGLEFIPAVTCDAVYYVDSFDRNRYIRTDCIFSKAHEERTAELKNVAHMLGAKRCTIEIEESATEVHTQSKKSSAKGNLLIKGQHTSVSESVEQDSSSHSRNRRTSRIIAEFEGNDTPRRPELKWFAYDESIKKLIDSRCSGENHLKKETLEFSGSSSATMSQKTAYAIDGAIGKIGGVNGSSSLEAQAIRESSSNLKFYIEF